MDYQQLVKKAEAMLNSMNQMVQPDEMNCYGHLVMVPSPEHNPAGDFGMDKNGLVETQGAYTFAGISVLTPQLFSGMEASFIPLAPILRNAMQKKQITGQLENGLWSDVGTLERLQKTEKMLQN